MSPFSERTFGGTVIISGLTSIVAPWICVIFFVPFPFQQWLIILLAVIAIVRVAILFGKRDHVVCRARSAKAISAVHEYLRVSEGRNILERKFDVVAV